VIRMVRMAVALALMLLMGGTSCGKAAPAPAVRADAQIGFGDGYAVVHSPIRPSRIGVVVIPSYDHQASELVGQGWSKLADARHFVAIYPVRGGSWNAGLCCGAASVQNRDDVTWLASMIADLSVRFGLKTIFLVGDSNGAMMAERLVAEKPGIARRVAVWGGAPEMPLSGRWTGYIASYDGSEDKMVPHAGGVSSIIGQRVLIRAVTDLPRWLIGASIKLVTVKGARHSPVAGWPEIAWHELSP
jgi:poly(3-hydroxybutyrate) depolymerase